MCNQQRVVTYSDRALSHSLAHMLSRLVICLPSYTADVHRSAKARFDQPPSYLW